MKQTPKVELEVNLPEQIIRISDSKASSLGGGLEEAFDINGYKKHNMTHGYDDIDYLQAMKEDVRSFAEKSLY